MAEYTNEVSGAQAFKKSWGLGTGSASAELQAAALQIISDSRLPGSDLGGLLNGLLTRYLVWPFQATSGKAYDATGAESEGFGSLIYTSSRALERVPADALACAMDSHQTLTLESLRNSYAKIAKAKSLAKSPVPKTSAKTPIADATMGIIFAVDSSESLERLAEELQELNKQHSHNHWVDMVVILSRGTINYASQFPHQGLGDFLPPARGTVMRAPMYVHIVARAHFPFCLNRMCALLFSYLNFFSPGTALPPFKEMLEGVPTICMPIAAYQMNLSGELVPVPPEFRFNPFAVVSFRVLDGSGAELGRVSYLPWQDGGVVRVTGKLPIETVLVFAGKEALSEPVVRFGGDQLSSVIPLSRQQFIDAANRMAKQSRNMQLKPDRQPNWVVEKIGNEGSGSPFIGRLYVGICHLRDQAISDAKAKADFDVALEALLTGLENVRTAGSEVVKLFKERRQQVASGEIVKAAGGAIQIDGSIDRQLRKAVDEVISNAGRTMKDRMQAVLRAANLNIGFLYKQQSAFENGIKILSQKNPQLADYLTKTRLKWSERLTKCRTDLEHGTWVLPKVRYVVHGNSMQVVEPQVNGQPVTEFASHVVDRLCCFAEDLIAHALQAHMPNGVSISEIPIAERNPEIVERFRPALVRGGASIWEISYHDSKFEEH
jgi:hypothetical protein